MQSICVDTTHPEFASGPGAAMGGKRQSGFGPQLQSRFSDHRSAF
jgi:hypothetical protein